MCEWGYDILDDGDKIGLNYEGEIEVPFTINFPEESVHGLWINCSDALGNTAEYRDVFVVDKTKPETTLWFEGPVHTEVGNATVDTMKWITTKTDIGLDATDDVGPHDSGVAETKWRITQMDSNEPCEQISVCNAAEGNGTWTDYEGAFNALEESCHLIEYYSVDGVKN